VSRPRFAIALVPRAAESNFPEIVVRQNNRKGAPRNALRGPAFFFVIFRRSVRRSRREPMTAVRGALTRDPVDAVDDAEMLAALLCDRADRALSGRLANLLRERVEARFEANLSEHRQA
jgi:hypothetical protein